MEQSAIFLENYKYKQIFIHKASEKSSFQPKTVEKVIAQVTLLISRLH